MTEHAPPHARKPSNQIALVAIARREMIARGLLPDFSDAVAKETDAINGSAVSHDASVRDMRDWLWASIDNDDSRDLDQLSVAAPRTDGTVKIFVAVADVDAIVRRGSAIDDHARTNTTSVYTAAQIFPMLPEKLSTNLTSLGEGVDRQAIVVEMVVRPDGVISDSDVYRATVRNHAKLAYNSVAAWLEGTDPAPPPVVAVPKMDEQIRIQDRVAQQLRKRRFERGALNLETLEARAVFHDGVLSDLVPEGRNRAKDLIEDFMIGANGVTARYLDQKKFPSLRRVLRSPERWAKIVILAESLGETLPPEPSNAALEELLCKRRDADPSRFADLSVSVVKLLGRGEYDLELPGQPDRGHFGLALKRLHACDGAESPLSRSHHAATPEGGHVGDSPPPYIDGARALATPLHGARGQRDQRPSAGCGSRPRRYSCRRVSVSASMRSSRARRCEGDVRENLAPRRRGAIVSGEHGLSVGDRVHVDARSYGLRARLRRLREGLSGWSTM
jgi:VacB/RNase II family 3'-5' exoribonuclease